MKGEMTVNGWKTQKEVEEIKKRYPKGTRIELDGMDEQGMPPGLKGIVEMVDDQGQLHMIWENGRFLALIPGEDMFHVIPEQAEQRDSEAPDDEELER